MTKRMKIELVTTVDGVVVKPSKKHLKVFRSYAAVMRALAIGEAATVRVESKCGEHYICDGFGTVERRGLQSYTHPKRLMPEY